MSVTAVARLATRADRGQSGDDRGMTVATGRATGTLGLAVAGSGRIGRTAEPDGPRAFADLELAEPAASTA